MEFCSTVLLSCVGKLAESLSRQRHLRAMRPNRIVFVNENHDAHIMWSSTRFKTSEPCDRLESHRLRQRESRCISGHRQDPKRACQIVKVIRSSLAVTCYSGARENMTLHVFFFSALKHYYHEVRLPPKKTTLPRTKSWVSSKQPQTQQEKIQNPPFYSSPSLITTAPKIIHPSLGNLAVRPFKREWPAARAGTP
jgi:hypothetical protein